MDDTALGISSPSLFFSVPAPVGFPALLSPVFPSILPLPPVHLPPPVLFPMALASVSLGASPLFTPRAWPVPGPHHFSPGSCSLGASLLEGTLETVDGEVDRTVPAVLSPSLASPPRWSSSPLVSVSGRVRGVRLRRVPTDQPRPPSCTLSLPPAASTGSRLIRTFVRSSCPVCGRRLRQLNGNADMRYCSRCLAEIFPFNSISSDREFKEAINGFSIDGRHLNKAETLRFNP